MRLEFVPPGPDPSWYFKEVNGGRVIFASGQPVPLYVANEIAGELNEPCWLPWDNDFCPTRDDLRIDVMLRDGTFWYHQRAGDCDWSRHKGEDGMQDIVIFRRSTDGDTEHEHSLRQKQSIGRALRDEFKMAIQHTTVRRSAGDTELVDANGWHDIEAFQLMQHDERQAGEWPDESIADRDPTAIMGGIVLASVEQPEPPTLTVAVSAPAQPAKTSRLYRVMNGILLCQASALTGQALFAIGKGWPLMAVAATATAMWAIHAATR